MVAAKVRESLAGNKQTALEFNLRKLNELEVAKRNTIKNNTGALVISRKKTRVEVNVDKTKHMLMYQHHNTG